MALIIGTPVNGIAFTFTLAEGSHFLLQQGIVIHTTSIAVDSGHGGHSISIYGTIIGSQGISMGDSDEDFGNKLVIGATGSVSSPNPSNDVVDVGGGQSTVINYGLIAGGYGVNFSSNLGSGSSITNLGMIVTSEWSVYAFGDEKVTLVNLGTITSYDSLSFNGNDGADVVTNRGTMNGNISLSTNNDTYEGNGGRINGTVKGDIGNDSLRGGAFLDRLNGGVGTDFLTGRGGRDVLTGGADNDTFLYNAVSDSGPTAATRDYIADFNLGDDRIYLANMDANKTEIAKLFSETYGAAQSATWVMRWRVFFMACAELWNFRKGNEWLVSHYLFAKP